MQQAVKRLERFWPRVHFVQQKSHVGSRLFDDDSLDFVFIDAGHDYCSVETDMKSWWPKLRSGGLFAGDDYLDAESAIQFYGEQTNWSTCEDGSYRPGAVVGAVKDFAA